MLAQTANPGSARQVQGGSWGQKANPFSSSSSNPNASLQQLSAAQCWRTCSIALP